MDPTFIKPRCGTFLFVKYMCNVFNFSLRKTFDEKLNESRSQINELLSNI